MALVVSADLPSLVIPIALGKKRGITAPSPSAIGVDGRCAGTGRVVAAHFGRCSICCVGPWRRLRLDLK